MKKTILFCLLMGLITLAFPQKKEDLLQQISQLETQITQIKENNAATLSAVQQSNKLMEDRLAAQEQQLNSNKSEIERLNTQLNSLVAQNNQYRNQIDSLVVQLLAAKNTSSNGIAHLETFTNTNAKFTVPAGKTWYVYGVHTTEMADYYVRDENWGKTLESHRIHVQLKSLNGQPVSNSSQNKYGVSFYSGNYYNFNYPIVLPENTTIEFEIIVETDRTQKDRGIFYEKTDVPAVISYVEYDN
ncbi:MAG: hypothetical protein K6A41_04535 [Bacteroidales bacterium]|nr:hypothetical protein [Bacteroidales bacterium]